MRTSQFLRDEGIKQVEQNTDRAWLDEALGAIEYLAKTKKTLTSDDVWPLLTSKPHNNVAMGAVFRKAHNLGVITPTSTFIQTQRRASHARPIRVWASNS